MPINESSRYGGGELTERQKRQAEAAIFGLPDPTTMQPDYSATEVEQMREILKRHDAQQQSGIREFDLNKPPRVETLAPGTPGAAGPYIWQAFPRMLYDHENRMYTTVKNQVEQDRMLEAGWRIDPYPAEAPEPPQFDAATQAEIARIDAEARKKPVKK